MEQVGEVIANYVGHFEKTNIWNGNVGLAAHNRGLIVESYFKDIHKLKKGDEIIYTYGKDKRKYKVTVNIIIKETDWSYLNVTKDNRITLITCVKNKPEYRQCIQAIETK
ncbi:MAG: sortase [Lachnospiraceae bacterium]|jgi:sortase A|nr:sortase [Lachnospiraceae bacterium]